MWKKQCRKRWLLSKCLKVANDEEWWMVSGRLFQPVVWLQRRHGHPVLTFVLLAPSGHLMRLSADDAMIPCSSPDGLSVEGSMVLIRVGCAWWQSEHHWRRSIVVRMLVSAGELSLSCARLLPGWVTTLWLITFPLITRLLSVSQHGQLSHPSLMDR